MSDDPKLVQFERIQEFLPLFPFYFFHLLPNLPSFIETDLYFFLYYHRFISMAFVVKYPNTFTSHSVGFYFLVCSTRQLPTFFELN
jgi:hypothetical protein